MYPSKLSNNIVGLPAWIDPQEYKAVMDDIHHELDMRDDVGSVSHGSHRPQDLIPAFLAEVRKRAPDEYAQLIASPFGPVPAYVQDEGDDSEWWYSLEAAELIDELIQILEDHAPEGTYFGCHEGDGADFGFWAYDYD